MLQLIIIIVYMAVMLAIGLIAKGKVKKADSFFVAGRRSPLIFVTGSLLATIIGASATLGMAGLGFRQGLTGAWWILVGSVGLVFLGIFFARKVRRLALYTLPQVIETQYGRRVSTVASVLIVVAWMGVIAAQIAAGGRILSVLGFGSPTLWMIIFTVVFVAYTVVGGQVGVIGTDLVQTVLIYLGIFAGAGVLLAKVGGWSGLQAALPPDRFAFPVSPQFDVGSLISMLLVVGLTYVVGPDMYSRLFCAKDDSTAQKATIWTAVFLIPAAFAIVFIGMGAAVLFPKIAPEQAFPVVIKEIFSPFVGGLVLAGLVAAVMSSATATLLSAGTILLADVFGQFHPSRTDDRAISRSRWAVVVLGIGTLIIALALNSIIASMLFAYTIYTCGVILPVIAGFFKDSLKVTSWGAIAALVGGGGAGLVAKLLGIKYPDLEKPLVLGALALSGVLLFAVSFAENRLRKRAVAEKVSVSSSR